MLREKTIQIFGCLSNMNGCLIFVLILAVLVPQLQLVIAFTRKMMVRIGTLVLGSDRKQLNSHHPITAHKKTTKRMLTWKNSVLVLRLDQSHKFNWKWCCRNQNRMKISTIFQKNRTLSEQGHPW